MADEIRAVLKSGKARLAQKQIAEVDAELLLSHILGITRMELHSKRVEVDETELLRITEHFNELLDERLTSNHPCGACLKTSR